MHPNLSAWIALAVLSCSIDPSADDDRVEHLPPPPQIECSDTPARPRGLFDETWTLLNESYPYFDYKNVNWLQQYDDCLLEVCRDRHTYDDFILNGADCLLGPLQDYHVAIIDEAGTFHTYGLGGFEANIDESMADTVLDPGSQTRGPGTSSGTLSGGRFGYLRIDSFVPAQLPDDLPQLVDDLGPVSGFVIDVRSNGGGDDNVAEELAGRFTSDSSTPYGFLQSRQELDGDPNTHELGSHIARFIDPDLIAPVTFEGPVAILIGQACASSCESFVAMMSLVPNMRTFGATTLGASGYPRITVLETDQKTQILASTLFATLGDGVTPIEWNGIRPDEKITFTGSGGDEVLAAAIAWLDDSIGL